MAGTSFNVHWEVKEADAPERHIRAFDVSADGARLANGRVFHRIDRGASDGVRIDEDGNVWSSAADGVHCIAQ